MPSAFPRPSRALPIVAPGEELSGSGPERLERLARRCRPGDDVHRAILFATATLARHGVARCIAPGAQPLLVPALDLAEGWARGHTDERSVLKARSDAFNACPAIERKTIEAVAALSLEDSGTAIDAHAAAIVLRYAGLAAYQASVASLLVLDAVRSPAAAVAVPSDVAGALGYQLSALGVARSTKIRRAAWDKAEWELERQGAPPGHGREALAIQLFHEFLGAAWKDHSDAYRAYFTEFLDWALAPASS